MRFEKRILVAIKGSVAPEPVVERTALIAKRLGAEVVLMAASRTLVGDAEKHLQRAQALLRAAAVSVSVRERQQRDLLLDLVLSARELGCGLLIKAPDRPRGLKDVLLPPRDWKLLRCAPCPVLMVKQDQPWRGRPLLVALDAGAEDAPHRLLNQRVLQLAAEIGRLAEAPLELVSAHPSPMLSSSPLYQSADALAASYQRALNQLCTEQGVKPAALHVAEGPAESLIPRLVGERDAGLVVLGTVARRGVRAALLGGNTAEAILSRLTGDVLTLQPEGSDEVLALLAGNDDSSAEVSAT